MKHMMLLISSALALPIPVNANAQLEKRLPGCALELQMQQKFASKLPIVFTCRVQNQSKTALHGAVIAGPPFIEGYKFRVQVQCENGKTPDATPSNQVGGMSFSIVFVDLPPGESRTVPLAIQALPAGKYKLVLEGKHSANFEVVDSAELRNASIRQYLESYWSGDEFFSHVLRMTTRDTGHRDVYKDVEEQAAKALGSDDTKKAIAAAKFLSLTLKPCQPDLIEKHLMDAVALRCKDNDVRTAAKWYPFLDASCGLASRLGSDEALAIVLHVLNRKALGYDNVRAAAVFALQPFKQQKAADELYRVVSSLSPVATEQMVVYKAAHALCVRKDQRSLGVLFKLYHDDEFRGYKGKILFSATALYENAGVDEFIKTATSDSDPVVRGDAQNALRRLNQMRENHQKK